MMSDVSKGDRVLSSGLFSSLIFLFVGSLALSRIIFGSFVDQYSVVIVYSLYIVANSLFFTIPFGRLTKQFIILLYLSFVMLLQIALPVLSGPDEVRFHQNVSNYSLVGLLGEIKSSFDTSKLSFISSALTFSTYVKILSGSATKAFPGIIALLNCSILLYVSSRYVRSVKISYGTIVYSEKIFLISVFSFLMVSPSSIYWSATYAKDITVLAFCLLAACMLFEKKFVIALVFIILATSLRVYAAVPIFLYYLCLTRSPIHLFVSVVGSIAILGFFTGFNILVLMNLVVTTIFLFVSPNPFNKSNWMPFEDAGTWAFSPLWFTVEGIILGAFFLVGLAFMLRGFLKREFSFAFLYLAILCGASVLVLVGYHLTVVSAGEEYKFGKLGENLVRKKLMVWPIISLWVGFVIDRLCREFTFLIKR